MAACQPAKNSKVLFNFDVYIVINIEVMTNPVSGLNQATMSPLLFRSFLLVASLCSTPDNFSLKANL